MQCDAVLREAFKADADPPTMAELPLRLHLLTASCELQEPPSVDHQFDEWLLLQLDNVSRAEKSIKALQYLNITIHEEQQGVGHDFGRHNQSHKV